MIIKFSKYSGGGNDFILVDNRDLSFPAHNRFIIKRLCARREGVGADGVILLENAAKADLNMRIFNSDGSEAEMCGNGIRCLAKFAQQLGYEQNPLEIQTPFRTLTLEMQDDVVRVEMGKPLDLRWEIPLKIEEMEFSAHYLDTGVPHVVVFVENCRQIDIAALGSKIRHHSMFMPKGANANFASIANGEVANRTYERGVEAETPVCGTGATAAALAAAKIYGLPSPIRVHSQGGAKLEIGFTYIDNTFEKVVLSGPANKVFQGEFCVEDNCKLKVE